MKKLLVLTILLMAFVACDKNPMQGSPIINYFSANPYTISFNETATLSWYVSDADSVRISGVGDVSLKGTLVVAPRITTTYSLSASNKNSLVQQTLIIVVK
jgi:hypothetical protein